MYILNLEEKENFFLTFKIEILSDISNDTKKRVLFIQWGESKQEITIEKNLNG